MPDLVEACIRLIPEIYDIALGVRRIEQVLGDFARACGAERAGITAILPSGRKVIAADGGLGPAAVESYNSRFHSMDIIVPQAGARPVAFIPGTSAAEAIYPGYERSDLYNGWARPHGAHQIAFVTGPAPRGGASSLVLIADRDNRRFGRREQLLALDLTAPHLRRMAALADRLDMGRAADAAFLAAIERAPSGVVTLDGRGRVVHVTRRAQEMLAAGDGLALAPAGLLASQPATQRRIEAMIAAVLRLRDGDPRADPRPVLAPRPSGRPPFILQAAGLPREPEDPDLRALIGGWPDRAVMITIADPARAARPRADLLCEAFGLTSAEVEVALGVFDGVPLRRIAEQGGVAVSTVRSHLLRVFDKTGAHRQAELVRLVASFGAAT